VQQEVKMMKLAYVVSVAALAASAALAQESTQTGPMGNVVLVTLTAPRVSVAADDEATVGTAIDLIESDPAVMAKADVEAAVPINSF
jgi:hypothetical protein